MSAGSSSAAVLAAVALAAAGCQTNEPRTEPFHIKVTLPSGDAFVDGFTVEQLTDITGTAARVDGEHLTITNAALRDGTALGDVSISFDSTALPDAVFPPAIDGKQVQVRIRVVPTGEGPSREPLPYPGLRIIVVDGVPSSQFILWETTVSRDGARAARVISPAGISLDDTSLDFPVFYVDEQWQEFTPGECGLVYDDRLMVGDPLGSVLAVLGARERRGDITFPSTTSPWTVAHALTFHRDGTCDGQSRAYTQLAAWRTPITQ
ncbi:MAG: hypothetical protein U0229_22660 [Anaeromyxobacter sp.]